MMKDLADCTELIAYVTFCSLGGIDGGANMCEVQVCVCVEGAVVVVRIKIASSHQ